MASGVADTVVSAVAEPEAAVRHFIFLCGGEQSLFIVFLRDYGIRMVYADFRAGIDTVLALPKFDQPGSSPVIEIDRESVKNHLETGSHIIVEPGVSGSLLRSVHGRGKKSAVTVKTVTKGIYQFVQKRTFGTAVHTAYLTDNFFAVAVKENTAEKGDEK